jgi:hypothetical protein
MNSNDKVLLAARPELGKEVKFISAVTGEEVVVRRSQSGKP